MSFEVTQAMIDRIRVIAHGAGNIIMDIYNSDFEVRSKDDRSPVTAADERSEVYILDNLSALVPDIPAIGEESYAAGVRPDISGGLFWLIDALDGTKEFVSRNGEFTVNIGLIENGKPILGVVYAPAIDAMYWGSNLGAFSELDSSGVREITCDIPGSDGIIAVTSRSHRGEEEEILGKYTIKDRINRGSSLKFCLIAAGEAHIYPRLAGTSEWDTAAGHAILLAAGGDVKKLDGGDLIYGKDDILNPHFIARGRI
ncbi:MAG: 3'(2'),5'-bisphosphate nucleotidase CysQ [Rhodospirillales bacterium]|nr:3'(2'),5'-bisphosphate nucleotidase CysQ [Rhodospirillales bacterium]